MKYLRKKYFHAVISEGSHSPIITDLSLSEEDSSMSVLQVSNDVGIILHNISKTSAAELC